MEFFLDVPKEILFYYENSSGLLEFSVSFGRAEDIPEIALGVKVCIKKYRSWN